MREIKFDYVLEVHEQGKTSRKRLSFGYADVFNGTARHSLDEQSTIGYVVIAKRQYTGLKDKNGVEIYEGDIVQVFRHDDFTYQHEPRWISDIYWANGGFQFTDLYTPNRTLASLWSPGESLEVIGNIYEHGHLLEATK